MTKKIHKVLDANIFIFKLVWNVSPARIIFQTLDSLLPILLNIFYSIIFFQIILNQISIRGELKPIIILIVITLIITLFTTLYSNWFKNIYAHRSSANITKHLNTIFFNKVSQYDLECYEDTDFYNTYTKACSEANVRTFNTLNIITNIISQFISMLIILSIIVSLDVFSIIISVTPIIIIFFLNKKLNKINYDYDMENVEPLRKFDYIKRIVYLKDYAKDIRLYNVSNLIFKKLDNSIEQRKQIIDKYRFKRSIILFFLNLISNNALTFLVYIYAIIKFLYFKTLLIGDFFALINSITRLSSNLYSLSTSLLDLDKNCMYAENLIKFLNYEPKIVNNNGIDSIHSSVNIKFENVSFKYKNQQDYVLKNINFEINEGQKIAIVGYNGAGKSTFIKLLLRLYDIENGKITLNNIDIKDYNLKYYRALFISDLQNFNIYSMTVAENTMMGEYDYKFESKIKDSLDKGGIYNKINSLDKNINSILTKEFDDEGVILSHGQNQKISASRVFFCNSKIAILDEPSSALDPKAENELFKNIFKNFKTAIFISHRLLVTLKADKIYVMNNGKFAEVGNHQSLMELKGLYYDMFIKQSQNYLRDDNL